MLTISNISKSYGDNKVLNNLTLSVSSPGVTAIMGASGIGKTTLLNVIAGLEKADSGEILCLFNKISYKFQEPRLLEWLTAKENIECVISKSSDKNADYWLEKFNLGDSAEKHPGELSGGMQQRVALARALAYEGDLLLLDEPFSAVDADTKKILIEAIKEYAQSNAVILVTHEVSEAHELNADIITIN